MEYQEFQKLLVQVHNSLSQNETLELVFLCSDILSKDLSDVVTAIDLFSLLQKRGLLSFDDSSLLVELLKIIKRDKLIRDLQLNPQLSGSRVSPFRKMLFELSENITDDDLRSIKFLLNKTLPNRKLQQNVTVLQLFLEMEKRGCMGANDLGTLESIVEPVCPNLKKRISLYQKENVGSSVPEEGKSGNNTMKLEQYDMSGDWRGFALIINNYDFSQCPKIKNREGTDVDEKSLCAVLHWLGFEIVKRHDCNKESMLGALDELRRRDHTQADCVVCCVLTHGCEGGVYGVDGERVLLKELIEKLDGNSCPSLQQKPKLFFIQACQGVQEQQVVFLQSDGPNNISDMELFCDAEVPRESIPAVADYLVAMATVPGYVSFREKYKGTWFIQSLCTKLQQLVPSGTDLLSILTEVNNDVSKKADRTGTRKQMSKPEFTLTKRLVFPIPKTPMPPESSFI
ncbi:hypothetical protein AMELA_G00091070 [Ameiurus melas]|uniref:Caspase-8 n=1 Tax=Ameiurus melas TaxID=219545 RepID=A0A7J6AWN1_AMEME|nr:hypothetical protein AMELA_G00091070 [Ameiurus melas]